MSGLRSDLAGKRLLWLLVAGLAIALIGVLVLLRGGAAPADAPAAPVTATTPAASGDPLAAAARALATQPARDTTTSRRDPFAQPHTAKAPDERAQSSRAGTTAPSATPGDPTTSSASGASAGSSDAATSSGGTSGGATSGGGTSGTPPSGGSSGGGTSGTPPSSRSSGGGTSTTRSSSGGSGDADSASATRSGASAPAARPRRTYTLRHVDVRYGDADIRDVARLRAFPSAAAPVVQYLGVTADGERVAFAIPLGVSVEGDGRCRPRTDRCTNLVLHRGQHAFLTAGGQRVTLKLLRVRTTRTRSPEAAHRFYARVSRAGQCLRDVADAFGFDAGTGTIAAHHEGGGCRYVRSDTGLVGAR